ncbi:hypothetical protein [Primorskyibacter flagellatus]|uniref:Uncharacterized protein n=1 Tax=Primorskyibacter flagellatus TaxID=1387277 RepID=A0A1W2DSA4_9RHOB|nr:hypothetical protein [Primorskyibacter flagellatus]SMD00347.1 hypothetical protein SAMN06295998_11763 [Primorskyibacter flagellatus]
MAEKDSTLAVSNGAFTCRIEGFDRPADIVRLIDRYLKQRSGSLDPDPEQPDPQVLAKIVGCTIGSGVRAYTRNGITVLSPSAVSPPTNHQSSADAVAVARVVKIKRANFERVVARGQLEEVTEASVSPTRADSGQPPETGVQARAFLTEQQVGDDTHGNLSRLISKTNDEMGKARGPHGRKAIEHLRAAVAATKAGLGISRTANNDMHEQEQHYRQDLAKEVRTRSVPTAPNNIVGLCNPSKPYAKLVLEAEQQIKPPCRTPLPRNDRTRTPAPSASEPRQKKTDHIDRTTTFVAFIGEVNAISLPDLMEAATVYLTFVEGHAQFSRRQLMSRLRTVRHADYSRTDRLQCLAQLLEKDKIRKLNCGMFEVTDQNKYVPVIRHTS